MEESGWWQQQSKFGSNNHAQNHQLEHLGLSLYAKKAYRIYIKYNKVSSFEVS